MSGDTSACRTRPANPLRGEAEITVAGDCLLLRPTFQALVAAEEELGPLVSLVERAAEGALRLHEIAALFWFCIDAEKRPSRDAVGSAVLDLGLARVAAPLRVILGQIVRGSG